ncbi:MAG: LysR family transcriptional regulator [Nevskia sp.]|nr:LysR family transcriptional regulator [Nevskia sp.]
MPRMKFSHSTRLRLLADEQIAMGPGKASLLEAIHRTGSISAAAKALNMSYRRAWLLVETMNACFESPLVAASKGGSGGGGTTVTPTGQQVLAAYRKLEHDIAALVEQQRDQLQTLLRNPHS